MSTEQIPKHQRSSQLTDKIRDHHLTNRSVQTKDTR